MPVAPQEWLDRVLAGIGRTEEIVLPIAEAHGHTLADDVRARNDLPLWHSSAMDGYALRAADTARAQAGRPVELAVVGEVVAGSADDPPLPPGATVRIMTGAPVPEDADAVVPVELTVGGDRGDASWLRDEIRLEAPVAEGANVRRRGEDTPAGAVIARRGDALSAARLAALAAAGVDEVHVARKPRVAVIATGAELRPPGQPLGRGEIPESNSLLLAGMLRECGIEPIAVRRCSDERNVVAELLEELASACDAIVTTGGVGPGSRDVMRMLLEAEPGVEQARVAVRPGQPQCAGRLSAGPYVFALPGNPVSAACSFELFVRPALLAAQGRSQIQRPSIPARAAAPWRGAPGRLQMLPVVLLPAVSPGEPPRCLPAVNPRGVSHSVGGHGAVQGYALVGPERGDVAEGETVDVMPVVW